MKIFNTKKLQEEWQKKVEESYNQGKKDTEKEFNNLLNAVTKDKEYWNSLSEKELLIEMMLALKFNNNNVENLNNKILYIQKYKDIFKELNYNMDSLKKTEDLLNLNIENEKNQIIERRIYINDSHRDFIPDTYKQNKQYPYEQNSLYPISKIAKYNNINIRIDRFFNFIIKKEMQNPENMTVIQTREFIALIEKLEFNYTEELIKIFTKENIEKLKMIIYALKELYTSNKKQLIYRVKREDLISIYENCKIKQIQYVGTTKEIDNFFEYYYISLIKKLEKSY